MPYGVLGHSGATPPDHQQEQPNLLVGLRTGAWLDTQEFPELRYVVPSIVPEGTTVLAGAPKVGKSWAILHIALSAATGGQVFGCLPTGSARPVLYLALEDGWRRLQHRSRTLRPGQQIPELLHLMIEVERGQAVATIEQWLEKHGDQAPLVAVDTLGRVMPRSLQGESAYERDYRALTALKKLADEHPGTSMLLVHHTRKLASDDFVDGVSGTLGITGAADTTVVLSRSRSDDSGLLKVTGRDVDEAEYAVEKAEHGTWTLTGGSLTAAQQAAFVMRTTLGVSDRSADIVTLVTESEGGIGPKEVGDKLGIPTKAAGTYLRRLVDSGRIHKIGRGKYAAAAPNSTDPQSPGRPRRSASKRKHLRAVESVDSVDSEGQSNDD
jgi:hypothetical protein